VLLDEVVEVVQNLALALREREHGHPPVFFWARNWEDYMRT